MSGKLFSLDEGLLMGDPSVMYLSEGFWISLYPLIPERPFPLLTNIVLLSCPARYQLKAFRNSFLTGINDKQMDVIRGGNVIEHTKDVSFSGLKKPISPTLPVFVKFKEKLLFMAPMCYMPNATWDVMPVCSCHKDEPWGKKINTDYKNFDLSTKISEYLNLFNIISTGHFASTGNLLCQDSFLGWPFGCRKGTFKG